jgi:hypothetical protein
LSPSVNDVHEHESPSPFDDIERRNRRRMAEAKDYSAPLMMAGFAAFWFVFWWTIGWIVRGFVADSAHSE